MANQYVNKVVINGQTKIDLTGDTVDAAHLLSPYTAHDKTGASITGTCTYDADTSDANASASEILNGKIAYVAGQKVTGNMPNRGSVSGSISTKAGEYTVQQGYHDGSGKVSIDSTEQAKIIPENIREGVSILGVVGEMSGSEDVHAQSKSATPTFSQQTIIPDEEYNYLTQVTIAPIPVTETDNPQGGVTITVG